MRNSLGYSDEEFIKELAGGSAPLVFTDELKLDAADLLKQYTDQLKEIDKYIKSNLGNIQPEDDEKEILYKMHEHAKHVTENLNKLNLEEESLPKVSSNFLSKEFSQLFNLYSTFKYSLPAMV